MSKLTIVARVVAKKDAIERVKGEGLKLVAPTRKEEGCLGYVLHQDNENPAVFVFYENWKSAEDLDKHMNTPHFKSFAAAVGDITEEIAINKLTEL